MTTYSDQFFYGFVKAAFKYQPREIDTCWNSGKKVIYGMIMTFEKYIDNPWNKEVIYDWNDLNLKIYDMCFYPDTW